MLLRVVLMLLLESAMCFVVRTTKHRIIPITIRRSSGGSSRRYVSNPPRVQIRDWNKGDGHAIYDLLVSADEDGSFNPEGALELDCRTERLLAESYDPEDGGCFLVAELLGDNSNTETNNERLAAGGGLLVGTAGLIVGTPIQYQTSGSSMSSPEMTAAVRRCVVCLPALPPHKSVKATDFLSAKFIQKKLLVAIEERAMQAKATQLIGLAYPSSTSSSIQLKPTFCLMEELGYKALPQQLPGLDAIQCGKELPSRSTIINSSTRSSSSSSRTLGTPTAAVVEPPSSTTTSSSLSEVAVAVAILVGIIWGGTASVGQLLGFDMSLNDSSAINVNVNRGLGRPLSTEDLGQLLQDEQLQRTTLDGDDGNNRNPKDVTASNSQSEDGRDWKDLSLEERREELALLQVIQGQNLRLK